ncbi:MAG: hypothetical protein ACXWA3_03055 [Acidimicrobiales bacterium]
MSARARGAVGTQWWQPGRSDWQVAALFIVGSSCFALGALPLYADAVGAAADGVTYFVGSIFFTSAALLQVLISAGVIRPDARPRSSIRWRGRVRSPDRPEWWAGVVQFVGTLMFNISTYEAMQQGLTAAQANRRVWTPDARGCIAFLVASGLAYADVRRPWLRWRPRDLGWSVATLNMAGSIAFAISALGAYVVPSTGNLASLTLDNLGTFVGGLCFLFGAVLLIPDEQLEELDSGAGQPDGS